MRSFLAVALGILVLGASGARAEDETAASAPPQSRDDLEAARSRGALLFRIHCASCHGGEGQGDGPLAGDLNIEPTDLTTLAEPDESGRPVFPIARVESAIDGRRDIRGHGTREMPVWGLSFRESGRDTDQEEPVRERVADLIEYLRAIQEETED